MDLYAENRALARHIQTDRLTLRPVVPSDAGAIVAALNDWDVTRWLSVVPFPYTASDAAWWIGHADQPGHWAIDAGDGLIGAVSIKPDLGYWLASDHHGKGFMTEAARAVVADYFCTSDADLESGHYPANAASRAVLVRLGFADTVLDTERQVATGMDVAVQRMRLAQDDFHG
ncbi:GNAT family N-acetyltransferase [Loktanella sp. SALINAS62]|uniref:GNAT family N-acetyltransferase n=1 Tax=Loktanella sp. SALINAS62 TaxID=2706124 RepID=UPI001B8AC37E|nr:GNAT family N-acetyltransferase [Loktanella sp. SALINAS62]MBS1302773.1 GNAT family N-acetyltransferase [Loktanella sp. SALINAS62]